MLGRIFDRIKTGIIIVSLAAVSFVLYCTTRLFRKPKETSLNLGSRNKTEKHDDYYKNTDEE